MKLVYNLQKASLRLALDGILRYIDKDPHANIVKLSHKIEPIFNKIFPPENFKKIQAVARDKDNIWTQFAINMVNDIDRNVLKQMLLSFGIDAGYYGTKAVREKTFASGIVATEATDPEEKTVYDMYYDYSEAVSKIPSHRVLALNRGEKEDKLKVSVEIDD